MYSDSAEPKTRRNHEPVIKILGNTASKYAPMQSKSNAHALLRCFIRNHLGFSEQ